MAVLNCLDVFLKYLQETMTQFTKNLKNIFWFILNFNVIKQTKWNDYSIALYFVGHCTEKTVKYIFFYTDGGL